MIRFAIVGSGWRSEFYARVAKALPEKFEITAWLCRNTEKVERLRKEYGVYTTINEDEVVNSKPDFIVSAVNKTSMSEVVLYWAEKGIPVLSETPAALTKDAIRTINNGISQGLKIQVAEQYFLTPKIKACIDIMESGLIGAPVSLSLSAMHDYHAASTARRMLNTGLSQVRITGKAFSVKVTNTKTRYETLTDGKITENIEKHLVLEYENGQVCFYDFMSEQYRSPIRNQYINLRGTRGEIVNDTVYYLGEDNIEKVKKLEVINEFADRGLSEGETAVANIMFGMKKYADKGIEIYPMAEALYDSYIAILMSEAAQKEYTTVCGSYKDILIL